jgi:hypothetical protein
VDASKWQNMPTINGADELLAGDRSAFLRDRRRPGRVETDNPHLIALMRGEAADAGPDPLAIPEIGGHATPLLWVTIGCVGFWGVLAILAAALG